MIQVLLLLATSLPAYAQDGAWSEIVNGEETKRYPSAVAIGIDGGRFRFSSCSASVITPRILLTAAHCTAEFGVPVETITEIGAAFFGPDVNDDDVQIVGFEEIRNHPNYESISGSGTPENDVGIIVLEEDAPATPVLFNIRTLDEGVIGKSVISVGYGVTDGTTQQGGGIKRAAELVIDDLLGQFLVSNTFENENRANVCSGDSGGPQYFERSDGRLVQWSVHSWADRDCRTTSGSTRTDLTSDWLLRQVARVHGTDDLCDAAGFYGDDECQDWCEADPDCIETACACNGTSQGGTWAGVLGLLAFGLRRRRG